MADFDQIKKYLQEKTGSQSDIFYYLPKLTEFQKKEADFHNQIHQAEIDIHQLNSVRNKYYHDYFKKWLYNLAPQSIILEIGAGSGFDGRDLLNHNFYLIESDISLESIKGIKEAWEKEFLPVQPQTIFLVADGQYLPLLDNSVKAVFMVAALHHFENQEDLLTEVKRVLKPGGLIIFAMEPSKFMMSFTKMFAGVDCLRIHDGQSEADETHAGYSLIDFRKLAKNNQVLAVKIKRVWLILGFFHYGLEGLFRLLKLKKRLKLPKIMEWLFLLLDELLLKIPFLNNLNWHWIVVYRKK